MWSIFKRELKGYFYSPLAYVLTGVYTFLLSLNFIKPILQASGPTQTLFGAIIYNLGIMLAFVLPILTMRVFAEEKKNGTEVLLMTSPNGVPAIVMGKYFAALMVYLMMVAVTAIYPIIIAVSGDLNVSSMITSYMGYILMGAFFVAFGVFASSLTENAIVSAVIGALSLFFVWVIDFFKGALSGVLYKLADWISFYGRFQEFVQGTINLKDFVFFFSLIGVFLALAMIILEKKRWSQG
ncbi:ABC transporter permease subunit [Acetivibrio cellulolyticus]|uniref:ABC transporter permease subunit n=1 Tax=Acetivibrio cellulolyticus TaxID=35830 RepID=UPI0001E2FAF8|nr:ABC transporter permease subunit [Acetivibrio cellulolyticus]